MYELERAYALLADARGGSDWDATRRQLALIASLHADLRETEPSSAIGAAHLLREAAALLPRSSAAYYGDRLREIAGRLDEGRRQFSDLVWLRGTLKALGSGAFGVPRNQTRSENWRRPSSSRPAISRRRSP